MPEHANPDLDDLFDHLEQDLADRTHAPGAAGVFRAARRHRQTRWVAGVAAAAVAVAGALGVVRYGGSGPDPAARPLPAPAPLTSTAFDAAMSGWASGWVSQPPSAWTRVSDDFFTLRCENLAEQAATDHAVRLRSNHGLNISTIQGGGEYETASGGGASLHTYQLEPSTGAAAQAEMDARMSACDPSTSRRIAYAEGSSAAVYQVPLRTAPGHPTVQVWTARWHDRIALLVVDAGAGLPAPRDLTRVSDALIASLQSGIRPNRGLPGDRIGATPPVLRAALFSRVDPNAFRQALGSWHSGWSSRTSAAGASLPGCATMQSGSLAGHLRAGLGGNGTQEFFGYASPWLAGTQAGTLRLALSRCPSPRYTWHGVVTAGKAPIWVAVPSTSTDPVFWLELRDHYYGYLAVPRGATSPPDSVSRAVGALLDGVLSHAKAREANGAG